MGLFLDYLEIAVLHHLSFCGRKHQLRAKWLKSQDLVGLNANLILPLQYFFKVYSMSSSLEPEREEEEKYLVLNSIF